MNSRIVIGVGAWLLGAASAIAGSLLAVDQIGHGILDQPSRQLSVAAVTADLANQDAERPAPVATPSAAASSRPPAHRRRHRPARPAPSSPAGTLLVTQNGTAVATCGPAGAYLLYWSPQQGFQADDVARGPATVASVTFNDASAGVVLQVSCQGSTPVGHTSAITPVHGDDWGGGGHDD